ncbi:hypothetical protein [Bosea sp. (in: a-proteobacteria)]|uniref:hypothetical protein n=1 Tax=Bosea sp. (in: a-proteobacteria) TaxID=1871050 RepID=UPI001ACB87AE|nr:hypothetical protein [Bosea sp. (in: a-proteobacteria)]MBN9441138.1 hypothetical protein [Bosea sp. (in: a-proteobacteria)]
MKVDPTIDPDFTEVSTGLQVRVSQTVNGTFSLVWTTEKGGQKHHAHGLTYGEMLENVIKLMSIQPLPGPVYEDRPEWMIRYGQVPPGYAAVILPKEQMQFFSDRLSDLGCWISGFKAALDPDRYDRAPFGGDYVTEINLKLKAAIEKVKE